ncbi:hypothetical protein ACPF4D_003570 [Vibrio cholerae]|nr:MULTISPECIES: hypothetical protein [Vibrio]EGQ7979861.1 hypothetical protein [Vibrio cholerae]EGQ8531134.1 hypothetical protein [Vibrio cholerae]EGQ8559280.1 hypothetical protein [Vibrio cholerae]EGQ9441111.1 hypothetical protein [Vibrio cholerae]EGR2590926.1 hypothetical protein [Vibrio cholerae]
MDKHAYIKLIEYALENKNFSKEQACNKCGLSSVEFDFIRHDIFILSAAQEKPIAKHESFEWKVSPQSYFNYLQYCQYQHAIETANRAHRVSIAAIVISGLLAVGSLLVGLSG